MSKIRDLDYEILYSLGRRTGKSWFRYYILDYKLFNRLKSKEKIKKLKFKKRNRKGFK